MSAVFDGTKDLETTSFPDTISSGAITIACWSTRDNTNEIMCSAQLSSTSTSSNIYHRFVNNSNKSEMVRSDGTDSRFEYFTDASSTTNWYHHVLIHNSASSGDYYKDDVKNVVGSGSQPSLFEYSDLVRVRIGTVGGGYYMLKGKVADVAIWKSALSVSDINSLYTGTSPLDIDPSNLLAYWPLYDDATDHVGSADLAAVGSPPTFDTGDHPVDAPTLAVTMTADTASYSLSGTAITLTYAPGAGGNVTMPADTRAFGITGTGATLAYNSLDTEYADNWFNGNWWARPFWGDGEWWADAPEVISLEAGSFVFTGADVTLSRTVASPVLEVETTDYLISFTDATLTYVPATIVDTVLTAEPGSFSFSGTNINFIISAWVKQAVVSGTWTIKY